MGLKEAREWAASYKRFKHDANNVTSTIIILDNRITELEAEKDKIPFRELLDWLMCSDPWPGGNEGIIKEWINALAVSKGYKDWIGAFHKEE